MVDCVHLRVRSQYSLLRGMLTGADLVHLTKKYQTPALAITDRDNLFGALELSTELIGAGIQPIIGCDLQIKDLLPAPLLAAARGRSLNARVALLAKNEEGYKNLLWLASQAYLESADPRMPCVSYPDLLRARGGLLLLTGGCDGPLATALLHNRDQHAQEACARLAQDFDGHVYIELQRHGLYEQEQIEQRLCALAFDNRHPLPLVATNDVHFAKATDAKPHQILLCIAAGKTLAEGHGVPLTPEHHFKSPQEMATLFADLPEALMNTVEIAYRCAFAPTKRAPILPRYTHPDGRAVENPDDILRSMAEDGLTQRLHRTHEVRAPVLAPAAPAALAQDYHQRLKQELEIITAAGFSGYFLLVADFVQWARREGIPVGPGRGSGAGSLVAYALEITDIDPLRWALLFERFLNLERISMPDFDIDFCAERRDEVVNYLRQRYGQERVAQIITFGSLQARAALRDVGRVLAMPYGQIDRICKLVPFDPSNSTKLAQVVAQVPELKQEVARNPDVAELIAIAQSLEGLLRHPSTHAAGIVLADQPLVNLVPLYHDGHATLPAVQFNMKQTEAAGLVKFDLLGLKALSVMARAVKTIQKHENVPDFSIENIPLDDADVFLALAQGHTVGVFQMESQGLTSLLREMKPQRMEDIIAAIALYRPGPMENIPLYLAQRRSGQKPGKLHPLTVKILAETHGVIIYQEQVMQIAQVLAGYSLGEADVLRRAMGKKVRAEMEGQETRFVQGAAAQGLAPAKARKIFDLISRFADYGFNKSHATAYALISYQTAYLRTHYPAAYLAAAMTLDSGNQPRLNLYAQELKRNKLALAAPDINRSQVDFTCDEQGVVFSLAAVRNVGAAAEAIVEARAAGGPFRSLAEFARRCGGEKINKRALEGLAAAGAFDSLESNRRRIFASAQTILRAAQAAEDEKSDQNLLFSGPKESGIWIQEELKLKDCTPWSLGELCAHEFEAIGCHLGGHPLSDYQQRLQAQGVVPLSEIGAQLPAPNLGSEDSQDQSLGVDEQQMTVAGSVLRLRKRRSLKRSVFGTMQLSDLSSTAEIQVFDDLLGKVEGILADTSLLVVQVGVLAQQDDVRLIARKALRVEDFLRRPFDSSQRTGKKISKSNKEGAAPREIRPAPRPALDKIPRPALDKTSRPALDKTPHPAAKDASPQADPPRPGLQRAPLTRFCLKQPQPPARQGNYPTTAENHQAAHQAAREQIKSLKSLLEELCQEAAAKGDKHQGEEIEAFSLFLPTQSGWMAELRIPHPPLPQEQLQHHLTAIAGLNPYDVQPKLEEGLAQESKTG